MADNWIPVREVEKLADIKEDEWVIVQTQDGTVYPAQYIRNKWSPLFRGGLVEQLMHGKVAYWQRHPVGYPYVQCKCGSFFLQAEGRTDCPVCASFNVPQQGIKEPIPKKEPPKEEDEIPFMEDDLDTLFEEEAPPVKRAKKKESQ